MKEVFDSIVIGGGPAGCFFAAELAKRGKSVLVFERGQRGSAKVCGDGLSLSCVRFLDEVGFPLSELERAGATAVRKVVHIKDGEKTVYTFPDRHYYGLSRGKTNIAFRDYAEKNGARFVYGADVRGIERDGELFCVLGRPARSVVVACGAAGGLDVCGERIRISPPRLALGISVTVSSGIQTEPLFLFDYSKKYNGQYAWIFKTDGALWNVGVWLRDGKAKLKQMFDGFLAEAKERYFRGDMRLEGVPRGAVMAIPSSEGGCALALPRVDGVHYIGDITLSSRADTGEGILQAARAGIMLAQSDEFR